MKIILDEKTCLKDRLTLQEALIAVAASMGGFKDTLGNMVSRGILSPSEHCLSPEWAKIAGSLTGSDDEHLRTLANQMRDCFPKGKQFGTAFYYRCNEREIVNKLKKFFEVYGEYPDDKIIKATKQFVASYHGDYHYLPLIKYFISKNKKVMDEDGENHIVEVSELASILENMEDDAGTPEVQNSEDWLVNSRN